MPRGRPKKTAPTIVDPLADQQPVIEMGTVEVMPAPVKATRPKPDAELTPDQRRIRDLENQLALERGRKDPEPVEDPDAQLYLGEDGNVVIHVLEDGFTAFGKVWYRGQELEIQPGSQQWQDSCDRFGRSWLERRDDPRFGHGPWPGRSYLDAANVPFDILKSINGKSSVPRPTDDELARVAEAEARRKRAAPLLTV